MQRLTLESTARITLTTSHRRPQSWIQLVQSQHPQPRGELRLLQNRAAQLGSVQVARRYATSWHVGYTCALNKQVGSKVPMLER